MFERRLEDREIVAILFVQREGDDRGFIRAVDLDIQKDESGREMVKNLLSWSKN